MTVEVRFHDVYRHFGDVRAVDGVSLDIEDGEFFAMLGPSGSGKTTCLRLIAGFDQPTSGQIEIHGQRAEGLAPYERDVNTVFQDYALFPHMSILDNVAYGLMVKGMGKAERHQRAEESLAMVQLDGYSARRPAALSGGQRQRVALARALINHPKVLLLDEPLGALDLKLREQMQVELKALQRQVGITFIYVTHDQGEALSMSDRLAVFNEGKIEQIGTPEDIYERPTTPFVANFVGGSNIVSAALAKQIAGIDTQCSLRPEKITIAAQDTQAAPDVLRVSGMLSEPNYHGATTRYSLTLDDGDTLNLTMPNQSGAQSATGQAQRVAIEWHREDMHPLSGTDTSGAA